MEQDVKAKARKIRIPLWRAEMTYSYIDLSKVAAIDEPVDDKKYFKVYIDNAIWYLDVSCYETFLNAWLAL